MNVAQAAGRTVAGQGFSQGARDPIASNRLFATLTAAEYIQVLASSRTLALAHGDILTRQGAAVECVYFIRNGRARAELSNVGGGEPLAVINFLGPGDDIGLLSLVDSAPHSATIRAMDNLQVTGVPVTVMGGILSRHPEWYVTLAVVAIGRLRTSGSWLEKLL